MWPLDRWWRHADVLRAGSEQIELYERTAAGLVLQARQSVDDDLALGPQRLESALKALLAGCSGNGRRPRRIDLVLESAWAPVMLLPAGDRTWSSRPMEAWMHHRLTTLFSGGDPGWALRLDHQAGHSQGVGYAVSAQVKAAALRAAAHSGFQLASLQPAFAWGWQLRRRPRVPDGRAWWLWLEQDRTLIAHVVHGQQVALNPAAARAASGTDENGHWEACVQIESARHGSCEVDADSILVGGWEPVGAAAVGGRVVRWSVATPMPMSSRGTLTRLATR